MAATALVGIGFLCATNAIFHFTGDKPELNLQAIQLSLDITFEPASVRPPPQHQDTFAVYQATELDGLHDDDEDEKLPALFPREKLPTLLSPFDSNSDEE